MQVIRVAFSDGLCLTFLGFLSSSEDDIKSGTSRRVSLVSLVETRGLKPPLMGDPNGAYLCLWPPSKSGCGISVCTGKVIALLRHPRLEVATLPRPLLPEAGLVFEGGEGITMFAEMLGKGPTESSARLACRRSLEVG